MRTRHACRIESHSTKWVGQCHLFMSILSAVPTTHRSSNAPGLVKKLHKDQTLRFSIYPQLTQLGNKYLFPTSQMIGRLFSRKFDQRTSGQRGSGMRHENRFNWKSVSEQQNAQPPSPLTFRTYLPEVTPTAFLTGVRELCFDEISPWALTAYWYWHLDTLHWISQSPTTIPYGKVHPSRSTQLPTSFLFSCKRG